MKFVAAVSWAKVLPEEAMASQATSRSDFPVAMADLM
jgi:hypothetical protein